MSATPGHTIGPFAARPLTPMVMPHTGAAESLRMLAPGRSRPGRTAPGSVPFPGGWPNNGLRRTASFTVLPRPPQTINVVRGLPVRNG